MEGLLKEFLLDWRKKSEVLEYLKQHEYKTNERELRKFISNYNKRYEGGENELFIAHSNKGYILTCDKEIIKKSIIDNKKRSLTMLKAYQKTVKSLSEKSQVSLGIYPIEEDSFELLMRSGL